MISQLVKIQINLYSHREKDNTIIQNLNLEKSNNVNNDIKELLYNVSINNNSFIDKSNINSAEFIKEIDSLKMEIELLKRENSLLKEININKDKPSPIIKDHKENVEDTLSITPEEKRISNKLLSSIKNLDI